MATIASIRPIYSPQISPVYTQTSPCVLVTWNFLFRAGGGVSTDYTGDILDCAGFTKITVAISGTWNGAQIGWSSSIGGTYNTAFSTLTATGTNAVANDTIAGLGPDERIHTLIQIPRFIRPIVFGAPTNDFGVTAYALLYRD